MSNSRLVYSSDVGRVCPSCGRPRAECVCKKQSARPGGDGIVRVRRETQDRHGKTVTAITGLPLDDDQLREFAGDLKRQCGTGGSVKDGVIIMQGDCCDRVMALIHKQGYTVKRAGG